MNIIPAKTPGFVKSLFPNFVWNIPTDTKTIYLTFDDGPTPEITPWVLENLDFYNAKATFFCIGNNINHYPKLFQSIINKGHSIGNHTYNHLKGWKVKTKIYLQDVEQTSTIINNELDLHKSGTNLFRPPYGKFKTKQSKALQKLGYEIILWDVLSFDWDIKVSPEQCLENVVSKAKSGSIVVFHDSFKAERNLKYVLPKVLDIFSKDGYQFKAISQSPRHIPV